MVERTAVNWDRQTKQPHAMNKDAVSLLGYFQFMILVARKELNQRL